MSELMQYAVLGIGASAIYALAGQGIVAIYQGSGVLNFAHGAMALASAWLYVRFCFDWGWPQPLGMTAAVAVAACGGAVTSVLVMRPLRRAAPLVRVIATLGVLAVIQQLVVLTFGSDLRLVPSSLPQGSWMMGEVRFAHDRLVLLGLAVLGTVALTVFYSRSRFGLATRAAAENRRAASALGWSPERIGAINWALGGALAGLAGILTVPISGLNLEGLVLLVVPALAAALVGGFRSFPLTLLGALGLGVGQSILSRYATTPGLQEALPLLVIVVVLVARGNAIPTRDEEPPRLPRVGRSRPRPTVVGGLGVGLILAVWLASEDSIGALTTTVLLATVGLSLVVLTGLAGQVSLGQVGLAGVGALAAARASFSWHLPFPAAWAFGILVATAVGMVFAIPAVRTRGTSLAVVTMSLALALEKMAFGNQDLVRGQAGTPVDTPHLLGWTIDPLLQPRRYATVAAVLLVALALIVLNARSGSLGRRLLAVRSNERAAAALGISVARVKFFAFGLAASIAASGGVLIGFRGATVRYEPFGVMASINAVVYTIIGGVGYVAGAVVGSLMAPGSIAAFLISGRWDIEHHLALVGGALLILTVVLHPDGIASALGAHLPRVRRAVVDRSESADSAAAARQLAPATPLRLTVNELSVTYGAIRAVNEVSFELRPGRVTGLIGANGAGKSTVLDAISGFTPAAGGSLMLEGRPIGEWPAHRRAAAGIGRTFQSLELFEDMTVRENLTTATDRMTWRTWLGGLVRPGADDLSPAAEALIDRLELRPWLDRHPSELPFGRRRLLSVARAAACLPSILLVDEPAAGLNDHETAELGEVLRWLADTWSMAVLLVEHDVGMVAAVSDEIVVLDFGNRIFTGEPDEALADRRVQEAYLGAAAVSA